MPISPSEAKLRRKQLFWPAFERALARIDDGLAKGNRTFSIVDLREIVDDVKAAYQAVGWKVSRINDQRDGDYLQFEEKYEEK